MNYGRLYVLSCLTGRRFFAQSYRSAEGFEEIDKESAVRGEKYRLIGRKKLLIIIGTDLVTQFKTNAC